MQNSLTQNSTNGSSSRMRGTSQFGLLEISLSLAMSSDGSPNKFIISRAKTLASLIELFVAAFGIKLNSATGVP